MSVADTSAIVVLRPPHGELRPEDRITAENVARYLPAPEAIERVAAWFRAAGFRVEAPVGLSLSIVGPPVAFRAVFGADLTIPDATGAGVPAQGLALSLEALPDDVRGLVGAVMFTPPPAFGPTGYMR